MENGQLHMTANSTHFLECLKWGMQEIIYFITSMHVCFF